MGTFVLDGDDGVGREVGDTDGGVGGVDGLAAMTARMIDVNTEVFVVDFYFGVVRQNGEDFDESEGSLAEIVGVKGRQPNETVNAMLGF